MSIEAMKQALEAYELEQSTEHHGALMQAVHDHIAEVEQEPVGYLCENAVGHKYFRLKKPSSVYKPLALYTSPQPQPQTPLTDEQIEKIIKDNMSLQMNLAGIRQDFAAAHSFKE